MADDGGGDAHNLPPNEELFEQQPEEPMDIGEEEALGQQQAYDAPHTSGDAQQGGVVMEAERYDGMDNQQQNYYQPPPPQPNRGELFMPAEYVEPEHEEADEHFVMDQDQEPPVNLENTDATIWVDSSDDHDPEEHILRANFWLTYSDHNYDPPNPMDRRELPCEGPFPVIDGLDEEGNIRNQWMPDGYGPPYRPGSEDALRAAAEEAEAQAQIHVPVLQPIQDPQPAHLQQQYHQNSSVSHQQHHVVAPMRQNMRPMATAQPYSIGGNQVEYGDAPPPQPPQRSHQRGHMVAPQQQSAPHTPQFRIANANDYTSPQGVRSMPRGGPPTATIIRSGGGAYQQSPIVHPNTTARVLSMARPGQPSQPTPGSYQHIGAPTPQNQSLPRRMPPQVVRAGPAERIVGPGVVAGPAISRQGQPQGPPGSNSRPVNVTRPLVEQHDYEPAPGAPGAPGGPPGPPHARRVQADVAPHRMTPEQRQEQLARQRAQGAPPIQMRPIGAQGAPGGASRMIPGRGRVMGVPTGGAQGSASDDQGQHLLRSPPRAPVPEQHRKFQLKPLPSQQPEHTSYAIPITKSQSSNEHQLPAQLTEDPEDLPVRRTSESAVQKAAADTTTTPGATPGREAPEEQGGPAPEEPMLQKLKSPVRLPVSSASSSPVKHLGAVGAGGMQHLQKPTPPHRMTQEEKNAHFAKLATDKDRPPPLQVPATSSSASATPTHAGGPAPGASPASHHLPHHPQMLQNPHAPPPHVLPQRHHQDDTLAVVQSVFDSNKPRLPDTPKDKEAISKIADQLRFSADAFTGASGSSTDHQRHRTTSGGPSRAQNYPQMHQLQHHPNLDTERKRNLSGGATRYDAQIPQSRQNPQQNPQEEPHRPRGRPRGSGGRWADGQEPIAPHRAAGGARTLQPRAQQAPPPQAPPPAASRRNGATQKDSDSESDGINREAATESAWVMRCHCGMDHPDGDTVECESCKTWQHMACMGLTTASDTDNYVCEECHPRRLPVTREHARRVQEQIIKRIIEATKAAEKKERQKSRKSEPAEPRKSRDQQPSTSRKSAPSAQQPMSPQPSSSSTLKQLNTYSKAASALLSSMPQTAGADTLLEDARNRCRAKRMFVAEQVDALVTTDTVAIRQVIIEVNGRVSMATECKRLPGGGNGSFMYDGLMKGTTGEDVGERQELVCIDAKQKGNDSQYTRRSCMPNCVLKHVLGSNATLGIMVVATKDIMRNVEVTLPFDADWKACESPLQCAEHSANMDSCPFESERLRANIGKIREREALEKKRRDAEERIRLENEVRREREEKSRAMEEQERREREEKQKEEARKKREAEKKAAEMEKNAKKKKEEEAAAGSSEKPKKDKDTTDKKSKEKSPSPAAEEPEEPSTSSRRSGRSRKERNLDIVDAPGTPSSDAKNGKRKGAATSSTPTAPSSSKRHRHSTDRDAPSISTRKRGAGTPSSSSGAAGPSAKKTKTKEEKSSRFNFSSLKTTFEKLPNGSNDMDSDAYDPAVRAHPADRGITKTMEKIMSSGKKDESAFVKTLGERLRSSGASSSSSSAPSASSKKKESAQRESSSSSSRRRSEHHEKKKEEVVSKEKKSEKKEEKKKEEKASEEAAPSTPRTPRTSSAPRSSETSRKAPESTAASPRKSAPEAPKASESSKKASEAPKAPTTPKKAPEVGALPKKAVLPEAPPKKETTEETSPATTEGSVEKELAPTSLSSTAPGAPGAAPSAPAAAAAAAPKTKNKKLTMEDYKARRSQQKDAPSASGAGSSSGVTTPSSATPGARRGFIPSTEGLKDVKLSAIPLDDHPAGKNTTTTTTAPSAPSSAAPSALSAVTSPSTRSSRARGAPSESSAEEPAEHQRSLTDRIRDILGGPSTPAPSATSSTATTTTNTSSTPSAHGSRKSARPTRWQQ